MGKKSRSKASIASSPVADFELSAIALSDLLPNTRPFGEFSTRKSGWVSCMAPRK